MTGYEPADLELAYQAIRRDAPDWWHPDGAEAAVKEGSFNYVVIGHGPFVLEINRHDTSWMATAKVSYPYLSATHIFPLHRQVLTRAFWLATPLSPPVQHLRLRPHSRRIAFSDCETGVFIRLGPYLNLPGPIFDPKTPDKLSLYITTNIQNAIQALLQTAP